MEMSIEADLHAYMGGIIRQIGGVAMSINGMTNHVHLLVRMPTTHSIAEIARLVKTNSTRWVHERSTAASHGRMFLQKNKIAMDERYLWN